MEILKKLLVSFLILILVSCSSLTSPDAPVPLSPLELPHQSFSPLPDPGRIGAPTVPIEITSWNYFPRVSALAFEDCAHNRSAADLLHLIANAEWQARRIVRCHPLLSNAAQDKTDAMAEGLWASHTSPEGVSPNDNVRASGYPLPDWYEVGGNHVESFAAGWGYSNPAIVMIAWMSSLLHKNHITGDEDPFFIGQECMAVGYTQTWGIGYQHYWIVLSAPCPDDY